MYGRTRLLAAGCCLVVMFLGCSDPTGDGPTGPEFAKGGVKGKPGGGGGGGSSTSVEFVGLNVQVLHDGLTHGMTDVATVDAGIADATAGDEFLCQLGTAFPDCDGPQRLAFFGCPDTTLPCGKILFTFSGGVDGDNIGFNVSHSIQGCVENDIVVGGCFYDLNLGDRWRAASWSQAYQPRLLIGEVTGTDALTDNGDGTRTLTVYWQGQRGQRRWSDDTVVSVVWSRYPDLDGLGETDYFVFRAASGSRTFQACTVIPTPCWTEYTGDPGTQAYVVLDDIQLVTQGRGKKTKTSGIAFEIQAFRTPQVGSIDYREPSVVASNLESWASVMLVDASGKQMLAIQSAGVNPDDPDKPAIYVSGFQFTFPADACYEFHLLEVFIQDVDHLEYVWYSQSDPIEVLRVDHVEGGETTWTRGGTC